MIAQNRLAALNAVMLSGPAPSATQVTGTVLVPALFFAYRNTAAQFKRDTSQYASVLFGAAPPSGNPYTLRTFYEQMSNGVFSMRGKMIGWVVLDSNETTYTGTPPCFGPPVNPLGTNNCNGLFSTDAIWQMQKGFREALAKVDGAIDFRQFDNDGPDLIPNSGDDDGYVDMIMFAYPTKDGACGGIGGGTAAGNNHIWSHRFVLVDSLGLGYRDYITNDVSAKPGFGHIRISDYFTTTALGGASACDSTQIMPIGTAAHEFGHALGLPDLYATEGSTEGIGEWGLMGSGNFSSPRSPSRMEAWSLNEMGWIALRVLTTNGTYSVGAEAVSDTAFYVRVQGSNPRGEYFLVENRQAVQADTALIRLHCQRSGQPANCPGGLLIWHVDSTKVTTSGFHLGNTVNVGTPHGLALQEADGLRQLWCESHGCNRGDAGDYYPGTSGKTAFSFNTAPAAAKNSDSSFIGFAIDSIRQIVPGGRMAFRLLFGGLTVVSGSDTSAVISVDAVNYNVYRNLLANGSTHTVSVADTQFSASNRTRWRFASWSDLGARTHTISGSLSGGTLTATLNRDFKLIATAGAGGTIASNPAVNLPGTFIAEGNAVQLTATPDSGLLFGCWSGDTASTNTILTLPMGRPFTVAAAFATSPPPQAIVNLIGGYTPPQPLSGLDVSVLRQQLELNLVTAAIVTKHAMPVLAAQDGGSLVHVSSRVAAEKGENGFAYSVSKLGVVRLVEAAAAEGREQGVRVNCILPSIIDTPANRAAMPDLAAAMRIWRDVFPEADDVSTQGVRFIWKQWAAAGEPAQPSSQLD